MPPAAPSWPARGRLAAARAVSSSPAAAQPAYPSRTIRVIVPFPAGGTTDLLARLFAQRLGEGLGQSVIVENMGGAGGSVGADAVAKAEPDGHTLLFHNLTFSTTTASLEFAGRAKHGLADFVRLSSAANVPMLVAPYLGVPARDLKEFAAYGERPGGQAGALLRLDRARQHPETRTEVYKRDAGVAMDHAPFRVLLRPSCRSSSRAASSSAATSSRPRSRTSSPAP